MEQYRCSCLFLLLSATLNWFKYNLELWTDSSGAGAETAQPTDFSGDIVKIFLLCSTNWSSNTVNLDTN